MLHHNAGEGIVQGGFGNDQIFGGDGNDVLTGDSGADHFDCGPGSNKITDFQPGLDTKTADCE